MTKRLPIRPLRSELVPVLPELVPARRWCDPLMKTHTGIRRRGISLGALSAEGAVAWFHPADAMAIALTGVGGTLLVTLIVITAVILGNDQTCERVFRLLRWAANRPEPSHWDKRKAPPRDPRSQGRLDRDHQRVAAATHLAGHDPHERPGAGARRDDHRLGDHASPRPAEAIEKLGLWRRVPPAGQNEVLW
jgi:hypothetical protein